MFQYTICTCFDDEIFHKQCLALEKYIPNLVKSKELIDVDNSKTTIYLLNNKRIEIRNSFTVGAVYIDSEIELTQFFQ